MRVSLGRKYFKGSDVGYVEYLPNKQTKYGYDRNFPITGNNFTVIVILAQGYTYYTQGFTFSY